MRDAKPGAQITRPRITLNSIGPPGHMRRPRNRRGRARNGCVSPFSIEGEGFTFRPPTTLPPNRMPSLLSRVRPLSRTAPKAPPRSGHAKRGHWPRPALEKSFHHAVWGKPRRSPASPPQRKRVQALSARRRASAMGMVSPEFVPGIPPLSITHQFASASRRPRSRRCSLECANHSSHYDLSP